VLLLQSYHPQYTWSDELARGVRDELDRDLPRENLHIEYMDARRMVDDAEHLEQLAAVYAHKYRKFPPTVILSSDDVALSFLLERRETLFPGVPVVFCGVNSRSAAELEPVPGVTGILEGLDVEGNLALIERLHPDAREVVLLADRTSLGAGMVKVARESIPRFERPERRIRIWDDFTLSELTARVRTAPPDTVFLLLAIHEDRNGQYFSFSEHLGPLTQTSRVPIYGMWGMLLGLGVTGGNMNDPYQHGRQAATLVRRVLAGERVDAIPIIPKAEYRPRLDFEVAQRFDVDLSRFPHDGLVLNRPSSFYDDHEVIVWSAAGVALALMGVIAWLAHLVRRARHAERELLESQRELQRAEKMEVVGKLTGGIAHDFNNLLTPILGAAELLDAKLDGAVEARDEVTAIRTAAERAAGLVKQLMSLSRAQPLQEKVLHLRDVIEPLEPLLRRLMNESVTLSVDTGPAPLVRSDRTQLEQVIVNLIVNANDAALLVPAARRHVSLRTSSVRLEQDEARRLGLKQGVYAEILVADSGVGMSKQVQERAFEAYFSTKQDKGSGFGLANVRRIVTHHKGSVAIDSALGRGTRVRVLLPEARGEFAAEEIAPSSRHTCVGGTVLLVEDEPLLRGVLHEGLLRKGFRVLGAESGPHALQLVEHHPGALDILVTDLVMPSMNGRELWERLTQQRPGLPAILMTGYDDGAFGDEPLDGAAVLRKPFTANALANTISVVLRGQARADGAQSVAPISPKAS
jgi:signal transduction histidine kinase/CheY-like chemotaxis protein